MKLVAGTRVRHKGTRIEGVVLDLSAGSARVAFSNGTEYLAAEDLEPLESEAHRRLAEGYVGDPQAAHLRLLAQLVGHAYSFEPNSALSNARLEPKLHQAFVAHRVVAQKLAPRMILADEVGLGKTIEAGLIIKELRARQSVERVLIVTPASLMRQWQSELSSKFNEPFELVDGTAAKHFGRGGRNPFATLHSVICSLPFASQPKRSAQIVDAGWDLVVFDEAHRVRRSGANPSTARVTQAYRLAEELQDEVHGLLLLTATPVQLHSFELYSLLELVEPGLFPSFGAFERERLRIPVLNELMRGLQTWPTLSSEEQDRIVTTHGSLLSDLGVSSALALGDSSVRETTKDGLVERHPLANAIVRNRKAELGMSGQRSATVVTVRLTDQEWEIYQDVTEYLRTSYTNASGLKNNAVGFLLVIYQKMLTSSSHALRVSFRRRIAKLRQASRTLEVPPRRSLVDNVALDDPEEQSETLEALEAVQTVHERDDLEHEIAVLSSLATRLDEVRDSKAMELVKLLQTLLSREKPKIVVFTQFIETQDFLAKTLDHNGISVSVFNGSLSADAKEASIRRFRDHSDVLLSTEAGGEGRNLQFANVLVNFDLPWNPMKVEQRIGRLDRIGQTRPVQIFNLVCEGTLEERILEVLRDRIRLFEESIGALDPILGDVEKDIERLALSGGDGDLDKRFDVYSEELERRVAEAKLLEETLADFVLDRASFRSDQARALLGSSSLVEPRQLEHVIRAGLQYLGGSVVEHAEGGSVINLSPRLAARLGQRTTTWRGVFDPDEALRLDDIDFFACGHVLIDSLLAQLCELSDSDVGARLSRLVPAGTWVEVVYQFSSHVIVGEGRLVRHLIGSDLEVRSDVINGLPLDDIPSDVKRPDWTATAVDKSAALFHQEFELYRQAIAQRLSDVRAAKMARQQRVFESQRFRLESQIEAEELWIEEHEVDPSEKEKRVLPARRGRLAKARERLGALRAEHLDLEQRIQEQKLDVRARVLSAAIVVGSDQ